MQNKRIKNYYKREIKKELKDATLAFYLHGKYVYNVQIFFWNDISIVKHGDTLVSYLQEKDNKPNRTEIYSKERNSNNEREKKRNYKQKGSSCLPVTEIKTTF